MKTMLIDALCSTELRAAIVFGADLVGFSHESIKNRKTVGSVFLAKITRIEQSLQAAFIEYQDNQYGFLPFSEIMPRYFNVIAKGKESGEAYHTKKRKTQDTLHKHTLLIVQLVKEGKGSKLPSFTTKVNLIGFFCIFHPYGTQVAVPRDITKAQDKKKLLDLGTQIRAKGEHGLTLRASALNQPEHVVMQDYHKLQERWASISNKASKNSSASLLKSEYGLIERTIRDSYEDGIDLVIIDGESTYQNTCTWLHKENPHVPINVILNKFHSPLFAHYDIEDKIDSLYTSKVLLPSGGHIVIDLTEALVSIDVNSGKMTKENNVEDTAYKANMEAAFEITRQIKLRALSGLIIIDFIDMLNYKHYNSIEAAMEQACKYFNCQLEISSISSLGLMQISKQRTRKSLIESNTLVCNKCCGNGYLVTDESIIAKVIRALRYENTMCSMIEVYVNPSIALTILNEQRNFLCQLEEKLCTQIRILADPALEHGQFRIEKIQENQEENANWTECSWVSGWLEKIFLLTDSYSSENA